MTTIETTHPTRLLLLLPFVNDLIERHRWEELEKFVEQNPHVTHEIIDPSLGWTLLHLLSSTASTPPALIHAVVVTNPHAVGIPDRRCHDLPVHLVCRNSQTSATKLQVMLAAACTAFVSPDLLVQRNQLGGTPLHAACHHNAVLEALQALVRATHGQILKVCTFQGHHCITTLWQSYLSTIQGHVCVANLLQQKDACVLLIELPRHFQSFWDKCHYLARESYPNPDTRYYLFHALLRCNIPIHLYKTAIQLVDENSFLTPDVNGNLPLHWVLENRPYQLHEQDAIQALLQRNVAAAQHNNHQGDLPLMVAIRNKIPWHTGIRHVLEAYPSAVQCRTADGWLPFQLAALVGGKRTLETIFHLILAQPDLLLTS